MLSLPRSLAEPWWRQRDANTAESDGKAQRQRAALQGLASRPVKLHVSRSRSRGQGRQGLSHRSKTRSTNYTPWAITAHLHQAKAQTWHNCTLIPVRGKILFHRRKQYCRKMATMQATTIYRFVPQKLQPQRIYFGCHYIFEHISDPKWHTYCTAVGFCPSEGFATGATDAQGLTLSSLSLNVWSTAKYSPASQGNMTSETGSSELEGLN